MKTDPVSPMMFDPVAVKSLLPLAHDILGRELSPVGTNAFFDDLDVIKAADVELFNKIDDAIIMNQYDDPIREQKRASGARSQIKSVIDKVFNRRSNNGDTVFDKKKLSAMVLGSLGVVAVGSWMVMSSSASGGSRVGLVDALPGGQTVAATAGDSAGSQTAITTSAPASIVGDAVPKRVTDQLAPPQGQNFQPSETGIAANASNPASGAQASAPQATGSNLSYSGQSASSPAVSSAAYSSPATVRSASFSSPSRSVTSGSQTGGSALGSRGAAGGTFENDNLDVVPSGARGASGLTAYGQRPGSSANPNVSPQSAVASSESANASGAIPSAVGADATASTGVIKISAKPGLPSLVVGRPSAGAGGAPAGANPQAGASSGAAASGGNAEAVSSPTYSKPRVVAVPTVSSVASKPVPIAVFAVPTSAKPVGAPTAGTPASTPGGAGQKPASLVSTGVLPVSSPLPLVVYSGARAAAPSSATSGGVTQPTTMSLTMFSAQAAPASAAPTAAAAGPAGMPSNLSGLSGAATGGSSGVSTMAQAGSSVADASAAPALPSSVAVTGSRFKATLVTSMIAVETGLTPFVAVSSDYCAKPPCAPITWIGSALVAPDRRIAVNVEFAQIGETLYSVRGQALEPADLGPGVNALLSDETPSLVQDLLRGGIGSAADWLNASLNAKTTTVVGSAAVSSQSAPGLFDFFVGRVAGLFSLPAGSKAVIRVARLPAGSPVVVLFGIAPLNFAPQK